MPIAWFKKKQDPLTDRSKELSKEIADLEAEIRKLNARKQDRQPQMRSTVRPGQITPAPAAPTLSADPVFERVDVRRVNTADPEDTPEHYNDLGVRKYDLVALWRRIRNHFHGPPAHSPRLINYLAAGSIHGLRPLRYETRVARNRFIAIFVFFLLVLWGVIYMISRHR